MSFKSFLLLTILGLTQGVAAKLVATPQDLLKNYCSTNCLFEEKNILLTDEEAKKIGIAAERFVQDKIYKFFLIKKDGKTIAWAGLVTQRVRAKDMTALYFIKAPGNIDSIEMVAFYEPPEYMPQKDWLTHFKGKKSTKELTLRGDIPNISGATISAEGISDSAALVLSIWKFKFDAEKKK